MIPTKEVDYLEQDEPIRNQNFVCLSFVSPEEVIKSKNEYFFEKYTKAYVQKNKEYVQTLETLFPDKTDEIRIMKDNFDFLFDESKVMDSFRYFVQDKHKELEDEYHKLNDFQTTIRGIKVRGTYDTLQEAQARSEKLRKIEGNKFSIYVAQVGCWCPWSPNPEHIENQEFAETALNTLMKKYQENQENKAIHFQERKDEMKKNIDNAEKKKADMREAGSSGTSISIIEENDEKTIELSVEEKGMKDSMYEKEDPWLKNKQVAKE